MKKLVVVLNGPPGSGKDSIKNALITKVNSCQNILASGFEFKRHLHTVAMTIGHVSPDEWYTRYNDRTLKEIPWEKLGGLSQRQFLIKISEDWIKPVFGKEYFGSCLAQDINDVFNSYSEITNLTAAVAIVSDGGFVDELYPLVKMFKHEDRGLGNILVIHLSREGTSFNNDSRRYIPNNDNWCTIDIVNVDNNLDKAVDKIYKVIQLMINN